MMQSAKLAVPATLFAAGVFAAPGHAAAVDYTATPGTGTAINLVGDSTAEFDFSQDGQGTAASPYTYSLEGKLGSGNMVGARADQPYYPAASNSGLEKTQDVTDGYYGLYFTASDFNPMPIPGPVPGPAPTAAPEIEYTGYAKVDGGGSHISEISFHEVSAVPETATWAMMILGMGTAGAALRQRRRQVALAA